MIDQKIYKCELCGADVLAEVALLHDVAGEVHPFCSAEHLAEWRELDEAVARAHDPERASRLGP